MKRNLIARLFLVAALCAFACQAGAITRSLTYHGSTLSTVVNLKNTVAQHTADLTIDFAVDYVITAEEGTAAMTARLDIADDQAVVVFSNIRPSKVVAEWLRFITIHGATATDGVNCRVETYRHGSIVLPYADNCHPLTVYKNTGAAGEANSAYDVNVAYDRLGDFDNAINSFTLKRGYMVTMANHADGTGYSHCFIANDGDITVTLPYDMRNSVSFLRVFPWQWPSKKGYAGLSTTPMGLMRVTWFYQWNAENYQYADYDYVPQRHHENGATYTGTPTYAWPSWNAINGCSSAHVLGVNEPDNTSGSEMYMPVADLIKLHADYLRSGKRIGTFATCNPNVGWVKAYIDSCEAHNYRVDFVATHYYIGGQTPQACVSSLKSLFDATGLPVWCTEWNNGANWTSETQFYTDSLGSWYRWGSGDDQKMNGIWLRDVLKRADLSGNTEWLERLAVYNNVEQKRFVNWETDDHWTTAGGNIFGSYRSDFAYRKSSDVWMDWRDQGNPSRLNAGVTLDGSAVRLVWNDPNTDWTKTVYIQQRASGNTWTTRATLGVADEADREALVPLADCPGNRVFRVVCVDAVGKEHYSNVADLTTADLPDGYMKLTSLPARSGDFYYLVRSKTNKNLCWTLADAQPTDDYTALVGREKADWQGASGTASGNGIALVELYNSSSSGVKMSQKVSSLPNGVYRAVLYASSHNARGEDGATLNGTRDDVAYVFATAAGITQKTYFTASGVTPGFLGNEPLECVIDNIRVTDGNVTLGLGLDVARITGWHCIQIKSLTRTGDIAGVEAGANAFKAIHYAPMAEAGTDLAQAWRLEPVASGYALRCPARHDDVLCSPSSAVVQTNGKTHVGGDGSLFLPVYNASLDCWRMRNVAHATYLGVGGTPTEGDEVAGNLTESAADRLELYAIAKLDFHQKYMVEEGHHEANFTFDNPGLSWGVAAGDVQGSGRVEVPVGWRLQKHFDGWNDAFVGAAALSDGHVGNYFNAWAGTFNYAELLQEVPSLPNGVYRLQADFATTDGYSRTTSRTALYANAGEGNISRAYNISGVGDNTFQPYTCYVLVEDNKMTLGARSDGTWFKVADFRLEYVCPADEASEEVLGWLDNGRALQHQCWVMDSGWVDLSAFPACRNLQIDQTPANALVKMAPGATVDVAYNPTNIICDGHCAHLRIVDEAPLVVEEPFVADQLTYERSGASDGWQPLFVPFAVPASATMDVAEVVAVDDGKAMALSVKASRPNIPSMVKTGDTQWQFAEVAVERTVEYADQRTGMNGYYSAGKPVSPLRWCGTDGTPLSDLEVAFLCDVNRDGLVSVSDVTAMVSIIMGGDVVPPYQYDHVAADINRDGIISVADVTGLVYYILNNRLP